MQISGEIGGEKEAERSMKIRSHNHCLHTGRKKGAILNINRDTRGNDTDIGEL